MHETGAASLLAGSKAYALKWADTEAAAELRQQLPLAKTFTELHGNEKYYKLPQHLTAANLGCMAGTMISGFFIHSLGLPFVVCGGLLLAAAALLLTKFVHCRADEQQATDCLINS